ncbi:transglycosylase domain-containing protein [Paenibacillus glufosinatiresistens]|uniref:transglycosylase domain-containing protein n=1 Tax=Paenibacillus glufosinatiresistens TaxID=3070657 RepID=UPI00286DD96C|nr:transglycosylase domain-containing protein [Paenibacillus sp. YX.27]
MVEDNKQKKAKPNPTPKPGRRSWLRRLGSVFKWMFILGLMGVLFAGGAVGGYIASIVKDDPVRSGKLIHEEIEKNDVTGFAYFRDGSPIGQLRTEEDRRLVQYKDIPQVILDAVVSIEDNDFYTHPGVDFRGTLRAVKQKLLNEPVQTGGSTLTQQLARRVFLNLDRTEDRKVKEILLALRLERFLTKEEIITAYLNKVPFGNGASGYNLFGIKAAAKGIFGIDQLDKINIAQAAYLAGLPQLPSSYSAFKGTGEFNEAAFKRAVERQQLVLRRMLEENKITSEEYREALAFDIKGSLAPRTQKAYVTYPYLMLETERQATAILLSMENAKSDTDAGAAENAPSAASANNSSQAFEDARRKLMTGGYRVYTTIDKKVYSAMHSVSEDSSNFTPDSKTKGKEQTAGMMIDNKSGAILGMIEGRDFNIEQMNYATQMIRQPGSTMKPIAAYLPALEAGLIQPAGILDDAPMVMKDGEKGFHIPKNANNRYQGLVTARYALNNSLNLPALKLFNEKVGIKNAWAFARKLGITTLEDKDDYAQTGVLGGLTHGVSVEELTNAYSAIGNGGVFNDAYMIDKIVDAAGHIVYQHKAEPATVFSPQTAYLMTDMLRTVITDGTGSTVKSSYKHFQDIPIVGKTGSTQNYGDVWFMGYTPDVTLGMWVGYKEQINTLEGKTQRKQAQALWSKVMNAVIDRRPELFETKTFSKPEGIVKRTVSAYSGKLPTDLTDKFTTDLFNEKYVPTDSDDGIAQATYITYKGVNYIPQEGTPEDFLKDKVVVKRDKPIQELVKELLDAFKGMKEHEPLEYYMPEDARTDMPTEVDPRVDDGAAPQAPARVSVSYATGKAVVTFTPSHSADVVGYRLYRSLDGVSYQKQAVLSAGDGSTFYSGTPASSGAIFYVVAVDVAGHESSSERVGAPTPEPSPSPDNTLPPGLGLPEGEPTPGSGEQPGGLLPGADAGVDPGTVADPGTGAVDPGMIIVQPGGEGTEVDTD